MSQSTDALTAFCEGCLKIQVLFRNAVDTCGWDYTSHN